MKSRDFAYWLQGLFELGDISDLDERQTALIKSHLNMVFIHEIDPGFPAEQQQVLDRAHSQPDFSNPPKPRLQPMC
jgi:hypothetical protein